jgi:hypothetical protein
LQIPMGARRRAPAARTGFCKPNNRTPATESLTTERAIPGLPVLLAAQLWCAMNRPACCAYSGKCTVKAADWLTILR